MSLATSLGSRSSSSTTSRVAAIASSPSSNNQLSPPATAATAAATTTPTGGGGGGHAVGGAHGAGLPTGSTLLGARTGSGSSVASSSSISGGASIDDIDDNAWLTTNIRPEWRSQYVDFNRLKRQIKKIIEEDKVLYALSLSYIYACTLNVSCCCGNRQQVIKVSVIQADWVAHTKCFGSY
jgi:hypothetical protein